MAFVLLLLLLLSSALPATATATATRCDPKNIPQDEIAALQPRITHS